jgi:hypothetical protein
MISSGDDRRVKKIIFTIPAQADVRRIDRETAMRILTALYRFADGLHQSVLEVPGVGFAAGVGEGIAVCV